MFLRRRRSLTTVITKKVHFYSKITYAWEHTTQQREGKVPAWTRGRKIHSHHVQGTKGPHAFRSIQIRYFTFASNRSESCREADFNQRVDTREGGLSTNTRSVAHIARLNIDCSMLAHNPERQTQKLQVYRRSRTERTPPKGVHAGENSSL